MLWVEPGLGAQSQIRTAFLAYNTTKSPREVHSLSLHGTSNSVLQAFIAPKDPTSTQQLAASSPYSAEHTVLHGIGESGIYSLVLGCFPSFRR